MNDPISILQALLALSITRGRRNIIGSATYWRTAIGKGLLAVLEPLAISIFIEGPRLVKGGIQQRLIQIVICVSRGVVQAWFAADHHRRSER